MASAGMFYSTFDINLERYIYCEFRRMKSGKNKDNKIAQIEAQKQRAQDVFKKPPYTMRSG